MNERFFGTTVKFVLLYRQFLNDYGAHKFGSSKKLRDSRSDTASPFTLISDSDCLPELSNEFILNFYEANKLRKGMPAKNDLVDLMEHFCASIYNLGFTTSQLKLLTKRI